MLCPCRFDFVLFKEYLSVILTFPVIIFLLGAWILHYYKGEFKELIPRIRKAGPVEVDPSVTAAVVKHELDKAMEEQRPLKEAIERMADSPLKEELSRLQAAAAEAAKQRTIAASLREQLAKSSSNELLLLVENSPVGVFQFAIPEAAEHFGLFKLARQVQYQRFKHVYTPIIESWLRTHPEINKANLIFEPAYQELAKLCFQAAPQLQEEYGRTAAGNDMANLALNLAPAYIENNK